MVDFSPQRGSEINKVRPALVVSGPILRYLPTKIVVPLRHFRADLRDNFFLCPMSPSRTNGLRKHSLLDCSQVKSFDQSRFFYRVGRVNGGVVEEVCMVIMQCLANPLSNTPSPVQ